MAMPQSSPPLLKPSPWGRWLDAKRQDGRGIFTNQKRLLHFRPERFRSRRALNFQRPPWHFLQFRYWYFDYIHKVICCNYYSPNHILDKYTSSYYFYFNTVKIFYRKEGFPCRSLDVSNANTHSCSATEEKQCAILC